jgi:hypothetical protein
MTNAHALRIGIAIAVLAVGTSAAGQAQETHLWPRFSIGVGSFAISTTDEIGIDGEIGSGTRKVSVSTDLGLPEDQTLFAAGLEWQFASRHSLDLSYYSLDRDGSRSLDRNIQIGDRVFPVGARAEASFKTTSIELGYTYWFHRSDKTGFGGTVGLVDLALDASASATLRLGGSGATVSDSAHASTDLPVPMIGVNFKAEPWNRFVFRARGRFLPAVTIDKWDGEAASYTVSGEYFLIRQLSLGASYDGNYYRADVDDADWNGSVDLESTGWKFFLRGSF